MTPKSQAVMAVTVLTLTLTGLTGGPGRAASPRHLSVPPDSYLQYRVYTVDQLIQQVQDNPTVRRRFARHFQIPEDRVVSYMRANLVESYIPETRRYTVYCVSRSGKFYPIRQTFHKGTKVFALRNGQPVLKWLCGNPLSRFLPAVQVKNITKPRSRVARSIETLVTPAENQDVLVPNEEAPVFLPAVPLALGPASSALLSGTGSGFSPLFLLPAAFLLSNNGGGGGGTIPHIPLAVPEPAAPVYVLAALPALALVVARRRRAAGTKRRPEAS